MKKTYEIYNTVTETVEGTIQVTEEFAKSKNATYAKIRGDLRLLEQRPLPSDKCRCGAETLHECVCDFNEEEYYDEDLGGTGHGDISYSDADTGL